LVKPKIARKTPLKPNERGEKVTLDHVRVEVKPFHSLVRFFVCPFIAVFAVAFAIISIPLAGQFSLATSIMFSLGYAWFFSAPLLLTGTCNLRHQHFQASNNKTKKAGLAASAIALTAFSVWAIQVVTSQISGVATVYLSIVSVFFVSVFAFVFFFTKNRL
jgi:hypothetical protein